MGRPFCRESSSGNYLSLLWREEDRYISFPPNETHLFVSAGDGVILHRSVPPRDTEFLHHH